MEKRCFVIMPFSKTSQKHTTTYWDNFFTNFVKPSVEMLGYSCQRSKAGPSSIIKDILTDLAESDLVLAVLTDFNPNVWYELGIRHTLRNGTIMIIEEHQELPSDISQYGVIPYQDDVAGARELENNLRDFVARIEEERPIDSPPLDYLQGRHADDYRQRLSDMESQHNTKLDRIFQFVQGLAQSPASRSWSEQEGHAIAGKRVLWVDDLPHHHEPIMDLYRQQGVKFDLALNTDQALDCLKRLEYDLIISDIERGSELDAGIRMIREIKRSFGTPPPIIIHSNPGAVERYKGIAEDEGVSLVTAIPQQLLMKMTEILFEGEGANTDN
ncbi:MAG: hypothetical protein HQ553_00870 [Chloroflexi bacterium]|nr:hypothetical protein [Chloroflexota bacterium]